MPLLYGEGQGAFLRLQLEIIRMSDDESIFAWRTRSPSGTGFGPGLLAPSPEYFTDCKFDQVNPSLLYDRDRPPYAMTNKGLRIEPLLQPVEDYSNLFLMPLHCFYLDDRTSFAAIYLYRIDRDQFQRFDPDVIIPLPLDSEKSEVVRRVVYVRQDYDTNEPPHGL